MQIKNIISASKQPGKRLPWIKSRMDQTRFDRAP